MRTDPTVLVALTALVAALLSALVAALTTLVVQRRGAADQVAQERWRLKGQLYGDLLNSLSRLRTAQIDLEQINARLEETKGDEVATEPLTEEKQRVVTERELPEFRKLFQLTAVAALWLPEEVIETLRRIGKAPPEPAKLQEELVKIMERVREEAREDLHLHPRGK